MATIQPYLTWRNSLFDNANFAKRFCCYVVSYQALKFFIRFDAVTVYAPIVVSFGAKSGRSMRYLYVRFRLHYPTAASRRTKRFYFQIIRVQVHTMPTLSVAVDATHLRALRSVMNDQRCFGRLRPWLAFVVIAIAPTIKTIRPELSDCVHAKQSEQLRRNCAVQDAQLRQSACRSSICAMQWRAANPS